MALALLLASSGASARTAGITGNSVPPGCNNCHSGGAVPAVTISGPEELTAGETGSYALTITGGAGVVGGLNVSASHGAVLTSIGPQGTRRFNGEITHTSPKRFSGGEVRWEFQVTAPCDAPSFVISGAGNSANGINRETGDRGGFDTHIVKVLPATCPDAGLPIADAGNDPIEELDAGEAPLADAGEVTTPDEEAAGCGCSSGGSGPGALAGLALLVLRRGRRI